MASLIPPSRSSGADVSVGEALRQLGERVARLETIVELFIEQNAEVSADKAPSVASAKDAKSKADAK